MNDGPLARVLVPLRRWWWVVAGLVVVAAAVTLLTMPTPEELAESFATEDVEGYRATHLLIRNDGAPTQLSFELIQLLAGQGELTNRIAEASGDEFDAADLQSVQFSTDPTTGTMSVSAFHTMPDSAVRLADIYATELVAFLDDRTRSSAEAEYARLLERVEAIGDELAAVDAQLEGLQVDTPPEEDQADTPPEELPAETPERALLEAERVGLLNDFAELRSRERSLQAQLDGMQASFLTLEEPTAVPVVFEEESIARTLRLPGRLWLRLALLSVVAVLAGVAAVFVIDFLDTRIRTRRQAEDAFGLPVLAELPRRRRSHLKRDPLPAFTDPGGVTAEVLRALRLSLSLAPRWHLTSLVRSGGDGAIGAKTPVALEGELRSMLVTSPLTGDGKSTLVANLAASFAEGGKRVLVVDCDFRRPAVGAYLDIDPGPGLRELASVGERPIRDLATPTLSPNVAMVRSGTRGVTPSWFMSSASQLVRRCVAVADLVIFDTGPITLTNEASALLPHVDTSLVVLRAGRAAPDQARGAVEQLTQVGAHVSGLVLMGAEGRRRYGYGYYGSEGRRGRGRARSKVEPRTPTPEGEPEKLAGAAEVLGANLRSFDGSVPVEKEEGASAGSGERERGPDG